MGGGWEGVENLGKYADVICEQPLTLINDTYTLTSSKMVVENRFTATFSAQQITFANFPHTLPISSWDREDAFHSTSPVSKLRLLLKYVLPNSGSSKT